METILKKKIKIKVPAKINLTLDVVGKKSSFHEIKSLVASINLYDVITLEKRSDNIITLTVIGDCGCKTEDNTAYKAAKLFQHTFGESGVDITIEKNIPLGAGLGGSSADISGVLNGMNLLFNKKADLFPLANVLGSDSAFMLGGGIAVIQGKGDIVTRSNLNLKAQLLIITEENSISAKDSYSAFDEIGVYYDSITDKAVELLRKGDKKNFYSVLKNDLYHGSLKILPKLQKNLTALKIAGASAVLMTGSGSAVYGIFTSAKKRNDAYRELFPVYKERLIKAKTTV